MNKEHFFVASDGQGSSDVGSAYNSNNVSSGLSSSRGGSGFSRSSNSNNNSNNSSNDTSSSDSSGGTAVRSSGFFGLENLSQEKSFCLFNASKSYLNCLSVCQEKENENKACDYQCGNKALDDVQYCIYYEEPQEEEEVEEEEEIVTTMSSLERMEKLDGAVYMPYAVYDTNNLSEEHLVNLKLKNGIQFAQLSPEYKNPGGELVNTEKPYLLWKR